MAASTDRGPVYTQILRVLTEHYEATGTTMSPAEIGAAIGRSYFFVRSRLYEMTELGLLTYSTVNTIGTITIPGVTDAPVTDQEAVARQLRAWNLEPHRPKRGRQPSPRPT